MNNNKLNESFDISKFSTGDKSNEKNVLNTFKSKINVTKNNEIDDLEQLPDDFMSEPINFDEIQSSEEESTFAHIVEPEQIIVPKTITELQYDNNVQAITFDKKALEAKRRLELRNKSKGVEIPSIVETPAQQELHAEVNQKVEKNQQLLSDYETETGIELPDTTDMLYVKETVEDIIDEIPDLNPSSTLSDFDLIPTKKDKTGYTKTKVTINSAIGKYELSKLATIVKNESGGEVLHRAADIRLIGNTNKTQLRGSNLKLLKISYTFKPVGGTVNKSTRIMISVPEDFETEKKLIIFIQRSRDKYISEVEVFDDEDILWLGKFMANFFHMTFELAERKLKFKGVNDPLIPVMLSLAKTGDFKVAPTTDKNTNVTKGFKIITTKPENQWLGVIVREAMGGGKYYINAVSKVDKDWIQNISLKSGSPITLKYLLSSEFIERIYSLYSEDWSKLGVDFEDETNKELFLSTKLEHKFLKQAFMEIYDLEHSQPELGIKIGGTLSKIDTKQAMSSNGDKDYNAEAIVGKSNHLDYFILTYLGIQIIGGDKRDGKSVIEHQQYNQKFNVSDNRPYQERNRTVLKKEGEIRNYNSRVYMFQLEYSVDNVKSIFKAKTFQEIKDNTNFLTKNPKSL